MGDGQAEAPGGSQGGHRPPPFLNRRVPLWLGRCDYAVAKRAVLAWHYSHLMPASPTDLYAVFEHGEFKGAILFGPGGAGVSAFGRRFGVARIDVRELTRVALTSHDTPVSRIVAIAIKLLRKARSNVRLLISYADPKEGHHGGIYQAGGWTYSGVSRTSHPDMVIHGVRQHARSVSHRYGKNGLAYIRSHVDPTAFYVEDPPKHRYLLALDPTIKNEVSAMSMSYPKAHKK